MVTTGGASVGDHDHMQALSLANLGADMAFWKIAMRPGKPMMYGRIGKHARCWACRAIQCHRWFAPGLFAVRAHPRHA
jgi:molybdopterin biosynthesis enzyme